MFLVFGPSRSIGVGALVFFRVLVVLPDLAASFFGRVRIMASAPVRFTQALTFLFLLYVVELRIEGVQIGRLIVHTRGNSRVFARAREWTPYSTDFQA